MPDWMIILAVIVLSPSIIIPVALFIERRTQRHYESWRCPNCGNIFGVQTETMRWSSYDVPRGEPQSGPILRCSSCQLDFKFDHKGREVDSNYKYVNER